MTEMVRTMQIIPGRFFYSVADPGCLSRIPDPDFYPSRIPDLGSRIQKQQQKRWAKKICCHTFFENYYIFEMLKKKIWVNFQRITELLPQILSLSLKKK
jgi:hypothetical protein